MTRGFILKRINAGGVKYATTKRERAMSKYLITLEVTTEDNPEHWDFDYFVNVSDGEDFIVTSIKKIEGESDGD